MSPRRGRFVASPAHRSVTAVSPVGVYRVIGRRPSRVYVDESMNAASSGTAARRLSDEVFWRTQVEVGDQIQERAGGFLRVTPAGQCHPIQLSAPRLREVATAFTHAEMVLREDREIVERLLSQGAVIEGPPRRPKTPALLTDGRRLPEDHPLVVENPPDD